MSDAVKRGGKGPRRHLLAVALGLVAARLPSHDRRLQ